MKYQVPVRWFAADSAVATGVIANGTTSNGTTSNGGPSDGPRIVDDRGRLAFRLDAPPPPSAPAAGPTVGVRVLTFRDRRGDELAYVTRRLLPGPNGGAAFEVYHGDDLQAVVRRDACSPRRCRFMAEGPGPDDLHAEGDLSNREYQFTREGKTVGRVSTSMLAAAGTYGVEVGRGEDEVLLLASAAVIDLCCQPDAGAVSDSRMAG